MCDALHLVCCLCSFHVKARSSRVRGWNVFVWVQNQKLYAPKINQTLHSNKSNIVLTPAFLFNSSFVVCLYNMTFARHIVVIYSILTIYVKIV